ETGGMFVVIDTQLKYHRPAQLDDMLLVSAVMQEIGRASLVVAQRAWRLENSGDRTLLCEGTIRIGWVNAEKMKPERIPTHLLELFT
ncbi:MAG: acyl-CoA thioesterase, partial [Limnohabitans sp.]